MFKGSIKMKTCKHRGVWTILLAIPALCGCQLPEINMAEIAANQRARPAELDQVAFMIGKWSTTMESKMMGSDEVMRGSGTSEVKWEVGNRFLVSRMHADMGGCMGTMEGVEVWTWDPSIKKFRTWWFDNWGMTGTGTATRDPMTNSWRFKGKGRNTLDGKVTVQKGTMTVVDDDTIKWTWAEYDALGIFKYFEMSGTNRRE